MLGKDWLSGQSDIVARTENLAKHMGLVLVALVGGVVVVVLVVGWWWCWWWVVQGWLCGGDMF